MILRHVCVYYIVYVYVNAVSDVYASVCPCVHVYLCGIFFFLL